MLYGKGNEQLVSGLEGNESDRPALRDLLFEHIFFT